MTTITTPHLLLFFVTHNSEPSAPHTIVVQYIDITSNRWATIHREVIVRVILATQTDATTLQKVQRKYQTHLFQNGKVLIDSETYELTFSFVLDLYNRIEIR